MRWHALGLPRRSRTPVNDVRSHGRHPVAGRHVGYHSSPHAHRWGLHGGRSVGRRCRVGTWWMAVGFGADVVGGIGGIRFGETLDFEVEAAEDEEFVHFDLGGCVTGFGWWFIGSSFKFGLVGADVSLLWNSTLSTSVTSPSLFAVLIFLSTTRILHTHTHLPTQNHITANTHIVRTSPTTPRHHPSTIPSRTR